MNTPLVFLIFNRPDTTYRVFEVISLIRPKTLVVIADGPRKDKPEDLKKCDQTRSVVESINWECNLIKYYNSENIGLKNNVYKGLSKVFSEFEQAIILEDDCLPDVSFFRFCEEMLERYRDQEQVMSVTGTNILGNWKEEFQSYHYSLYGSIWGWATWRRAWEKFDISMQGWCSPERRHAVKDWIGSSRQYSFWRTYFHKVYKYDLNTWATPWLFHTMAASGLAVVPSVNLISNIGFGSEATHTKNSVNPVSNLPRYIIDRPFVAPLHKDIDKEYDSLLFKLLHEKPNLIRRVEKKLTSIFFN